jgi:hypothetical protein
MMTGSPRIRASDADRDRTGGLLREHHARGRLDPEEFAERLDRVFAAKTIDELDELTADLPAIDLYPLPAASLPRNRRVSTDLPASAVLRQSSGHVRVWLGSGRAPSAWVAAWGAWSAVMAVLVVLLVVSGNPWPLVWGAAAGVLIGGRWAVSRRAIGRGGAGEARRQLGASSPEGIDSSRDES